MSWTARDEKIILTKHPHRIGYTSKYLTSLVIALIALFSLYFFRRNTSPIGLPSTQFQLGGGPYHVWIPGILLFLVASLILLMTELHRRSTRYTVTNRRIGIERGIISKSVRESALTQVEDVVVHQSAMQRILNVGDLEVRTEAGSQGVLWIWDAPRPRDFERAIFTR